MVHIAYGAVAFLVPSAITAVREAALAARVPHATVLVAGRSGAADAPPGGRGQASEAWLAARAACTTRLHVHLTK